MFDDITPESIKAGVLGGLEGKLDTREGSFANDMAAPLALALYQLYRDMNRIPDIAWVHADSGSYLDMAAADLGIASRKSGAKAKATLQIVGAPGTGIAAGKLFCTESGYAFAAIQAAVIPQTGELALVAEAQKSGEAYNVGANVITLQYDNDPAITAVGNPAPAQGGADPESDAALYDRIVAARQKPSVSGNVHDYERWALEVSGVGAARVFPLWDGAGTVKVLVVDEARKPVDAAVIKRCAGHIEELRPIGATVSVVTATERSIAIVAEVELAEPLETVLARFRAAAADYLASIAFGEAEILYSQLGAILISTPGVRDYANLQLNGAAGNVRLAAEESPILGEITWSEVDGRAV